MITICFWYAIKDNLMLYRLVACGFCAIYSAHSYNENTRYNRIYVKYRCAYIIKMNPLVCAR